MKKMTREEIQAEKIDTQKELLGFEENMEDRYPHFFII